MGSAKEIEEGKVVGILLYIIWIAGIIWYLVDEKMRKNKFVTYHVKQSIVLIITAIIFSIVWGIIMLILSLLLLLIPIVGVILISILSLVYFLPLIWAIIGIVNVAKGAEKPLPIIGGFAKHFKF